MTIEELNTLKWYVNEEMHTKPTREELCSLIDAEIERQNGCTYCKGVSRNQVFHDYCPNCGRKLGD